MPYCGRDENKSLERFATSTRSLPISSSFSELTAGVTTGVGCCQLASISGKLLFSASACFTARAPIRLPNSATSATKITKASASAGVRVLPGRKRSSKFTSGESRYANSTASVKTNSVDRTMYTRYSVSSTTAAVNVQLAARRLKKPNMFLPILARRVDRAFLRQLFNLHARDAVALHLHHGKPPPAVFHRFAGVRNLAQLEEQEARERFKSAGRGNLDAVFVLQIANARDSIQIEVGFRRARLHL